MTIETLFSTRDLWNNWTTILLGDVLYGRHTIHSIFQQEDSLQFYGGRGEIYALKFHISASLMIIDAINKIITSDKFSLKYGKLWNLYRQINGFDFREHKIGAFFTIAGDCQDFDTKEQYLKYAKGKRIRG